VIHSIASESPKPVNAEHLKIAQGLFKISVIPKISEILLIELLLLQALS
jgi:hypothetical protein